jgi:hypothetical protein
MGNLPDAPGSALPQNDPTESARRGGMPRFIVERNIPGADNLTGSDLRDISKKSNAVVEGLDVPYVWHHTYAAGDKLYCVHEADSAETIRRHAREGGFPADLVAEIKSTFGPDTANRPD